MLNQFFNASKIIRCGRTEMLQRPALNTNHPTPAISIDSTQLGKVKSFKYLGKTISYNDHLIRKTDIQITKVTLNFAQLVQHTFSNKTESVQCSGPFYYFSINMNSRPCTKHVKKLENFYMQSLCSMLECQWQDHINV